MSELPKPIERLDSLFKIIVGSSFAVPAVAGAYGLDARVVWVAVIFYAIWVTLKAFLPGIFLSYQERVIIDKMRGWSYVIFLAILFLSNYFMLVILPKTADVFVGGVFIVSITLRYVLMLLPRKLFRREVIYMNESQLKEIYKIFEETGSASIFFSISILTLGISSTSLVEFTALNVVILFVVPFCLFVYGIYRERLSSRLTRNLAISLVNSGWYKKYSERH